MHRNLKYLIIISIILLLMGITHYPYQFMTSYNLHKVENYGRTLESYFWLKGFSTNSWKYYNGFVMYSIRKLYPDIVDRYYDNNINPDGTINFDINSGYTNLEDELDSVLPTRTLLYLNKKPKYEKTKMLMYKRTIKHKTLPQCGGNFMHKINSTKWERYPFALDGLYMVLPFLAEYKGFNAFDRMNWVSKNLKAENGLYFHGTDKNGKPNGVVWLRGVGWYAMTQVDLLDSMPEGIQKIKMKSDLTEFFDSMLKVQNKYNGMWKNILYPKIYRCNRYETSGSLMMSYALIKAYKRGYVTDERYMKAGLKAFNGVVTNKLFLNQLKDTYSKSHVSDYARYYCNCKKYVYDDEKGIASLFLVYDLLKE